MKLILVPAATLLLLCGCITKSADVATTEEQAQEATTAAYDRADEVALKAQHEADEQADKVASEAATKIDEGQRDADKVADAAYLKAEHVEATSDTKIAEVQQAQFVQAMHKGLDERRKQIQALGQKGATPAVTSAEKAATAALAGIEAAKPAVWTNRRQDVERSFAQLDQAYGAVSGVQK